MMLRPMELALLLLACALTASAHLSVKRGSVLALQGRRGAGLVSTLVGIGLMALGILVNLVLLRRLPLTVVVPMGALVYVLVPLGARAFFAERLGPRFWAGAVLLCAGIVLIGLTQA